MDQTIAGWVWIAIAVLLGLIEAGTGTFMFLLFAGAAVLAGLAAFAGLPLGIQTLIFLLGTCASFALAPSLVKRVGKGEMTRFGVDALVDQIGVVTEDIDAIQGTGLVKVEGQVWRARAPASLPAGTLVRVTEVDGTRLVVVPDPHQQAATQHRIVDQGTVDRGSVDVHIDDRDRG